MDIVIATNNIGKLKEIKAVFSDTAFNIISKEEAGVYDDVVEDGDTYEANSAKKALAICEACGKMTLADDSGLEVDFLDKAPGVFSARFLGEDTDYAYKNAKILEMLAGVPDEKRTARFVCVITVAYPEAGAMKTLTARATFEGIIAHEIKGVNGFGYDPILFLPEYNMTSAELSAEQKNKISHRGKALEMMKKDLINHGFTRIATD